MPLGDERTRKSPTETPYPPAAALAMARAQTRLAGKYQDEELAKHAATLERRALEAIKQGRATLD
jgi:hypothetical protein